MRQFLGRRPEMKDEATAGMRRQRIPHPSLLIMLCIIFGNRSTALRKSTAARQRAFRFGLSNAQSKPEPDGWSCPVGRVRRARRPSGGIGGGSLVSRRPSRRSTSPGASAMSQDHRRLAWQRSSTRYGGRHEDPHARRHRGPPGGPPAEAGHASAIGRVPMGWPNWLDAAVASSPTRLRVSCKELREGR